VANVVSSGRNVLPSIASRSFGTTFHVVGTAAIQYSSVRLLAPSRPVAPGARVRMSATMMKTPLGNRIDYPVTMMSPDISLPWNMQM
jgi:hypothetical protein